eukprot:123186-Pyramimonas_sp.AAC.1
MMCGSSTVTEKDYGCVFEQLGKAAAPGSDLGDFLLNQSCKFYDVGQVTWVLWRMPRYSKLTHPTR